MIAGIDVSVYQESLDWASLYNDGIRFAFIRLGDGTIVDEAASTHRRAARAAGIKVAPYWFCRDREDPIQQTERYILMAEAMGTWDGPLVPDYEQASRQGGNPRGWLDAVVARLEAHYRRVLFYYCGYYVLQDDIGVSPTLARNLLWIPGGGRYNDVAHISTAPKGFIMDAPAGYRVSANQWTQFGRAGNYGGHLDLNVMSDEAFLEFFGIDGAEFGAEFANQRLEAAPKRDVRAELIAVLRSQDGAKESPPFSNNVLFWDWWSNGDGVVEAWEIHGAWCASYVSWAYAQIGADLPPLQRDRGGFMSVPVGTKYAVENGEAFSENPLPGDIVIFSWVAPNWSSGLPMVWEMDPRTGREGWVVAGDHVGVFSHMQGEAFMCWEGNTSYGGSQDDGGMVALRDRYRSQIALFWRPAALVAAENNQPQAQDEDMADLALHEAHRRPNDFAHEGINYRVWDFAWLPENGRVMDLGSGRKVVQWSAVSVALEEPSDSANGPIYVFVYDEAGLVGRMDLDNRSQLYVPRVPGRQSFVCTKELLVQGREALIAG